jgi:hypothetical protein
LRRKIRPVWIVLDSDVLRIDSFDIQTNEWNGF